MGVLECIPLEEGDLLHYYYLIFYIWPTGYTE